MASGMCKGEVVGGVCEGEGGEWGVAVGVSGIIGM